MKISDLNIGDTLTMADNEARFTGLVTEKDDEGVWMTGGPFEVRVTQSHLDDTDRTFTVTPVSVAT